MNNTYKRKGAQSILEYAVLIALVATAVMAMNLYVQRAVKSNLTLIENQIDKVN
jgi:Flp pilus assembly pilin Flp